MFRQPTHSKMLRGHGHGHGHEIFVWAKLPSRDLMLLSESFWGWWTLTQHGIISTLHMRVSSASHTHTYTKTTHCKFLHVTRSRSRSRYLYSTSQRNTCHLIWRQTRSPLLHSNYSTHPQSILLSCHFHDSVEHMLPFSSGRGGPRWRVALVVSLLGFN